MGPVDGDSLLDAGQRRAADTTTARTRSTASAAAPGPSSRGPAGNPWAHRPAIALASGSSGLAGRAAVDGGRDAAPRGSARGRARLSSPPSRATRRIRPRSDRGSPTTCTAGAPWETARPTSGPPGRRCRNRHGPEYYVGNVESWRAYRRLRRGARRSLHIYRSLNISVARHKLLFSRAEVWYRRPEKGGGPFRITTRAPCRRCLTHNARSCSAGCDGEKRRRRWPCGHASCCRAPKARATKRWPRPLGTTRATVGKWRRRFLRDGCDGLRDEPRPGAPRTVSDADVERVVVRTLETLPQGATHWSRQSMARACGLSASTGRSRVARLRPQAPPQRDLQVVERPAVYRESARYRRAVPASTRAGGGAVRG